METETSIKAGTATDANTVLADAPTRHEAYAYYSGVVHILDWATDKFLCDGKKVWRIPNDARPTDKHCKACLKKNGNAPVQKFNYAD